MSLTSNVWVRSGLPDRPLNSRLLDALRVAVVEARAQTFIATADCPNTSPQPLRDPVDLEFLYVGELPRQNVLADQIRDLELRTLQSLPATAAGNNAN